LLWLGGQQCSPIFFNLFGEKDMSDPENIPSHRATQPQSVVVHESEAPVVKPLEKTSDDKTVAAPATKKTS
jgi:hypothetical protein